MSSTELRQDADTDPHRLIAVLTGQLRELEAALETVDVAPRDLAVALPDMPDAAFWARVEMLNHVSRALIAPDKVVLDPAALERCAGALTPEDRVMKLYADVMKAR